MKFGWVNASEEDLWRKFNYKTPDGKQECMLELRLVNADEYAKLDKAVREDVAKYRAYVAEHWFRSFGTATDAKGEALPNTTAMRNEILKDFDVWLFVTQKLMSSSEQDVEGKGAGGSVS